MAERQVAGLIGLSSRALDAAFERFRSYATDEEEELPGGVLVVCRHGQTAFLDAFGDVSTDTIFRAASMTKITTSLAAMMLCDRGILLLDDPIAKFIPEFGSMERVTNDSGDAVSCATQITVRHLMAHTAGLTYGFFDGTGACGVVDELARRGRESGAARCSAVSPGGAEHLAGQPLAFEPGSALRYSASTAVLGRVVSVASGVPLDDFMHDEVFSPLGMVDTAYYVPAEKQHRVAAAYAKVSPADAAVGNFETFSAWKSSPTTELMPLSLGPIPSDKPSHIGADGGLFTTAADWAMFMGAAAAAASPSYLCAARSRDVDALTNSYRVSTSQGMLSNKGRYGAGRLLSTPAWEVMVAPATPDLSGSYCSHWSDREGSAGHLLCANWKTGGFAHSLCGEVIVDPEKAQCGPCHVGTFGWEGIFTTKFMVDPQSGLSWACFSQVHPCWQHNLKRELGPLIFSSIEPAQARM